MLNQEEYFLKTLSYHKCTRIAYAFRCSPYAMRNQRCMTKFLLVLVLVMCCFVINNTYAQTIDTLKQKDSSKSVINNRIPAPGEKLKLGDHTSQARSPGTSGFNGARSALKQKLGVLKKSPVDFDLIWGEGIRYSPVPVFPAVTSSQKFLNILSVRGLINVYGVPLNIDYSTDRASSYGAANPYNDLFKFDFQPNQFNSLFKSDLQQYAEMRKTVFGGLDLTGYIRKAITDELSSQKGSLGNVSRNSLLTGYLNDPAKVNELLLLDKDQIRSKLKEELTKKVPASNQTAKELLDETVNLPVDDYDLAAGRNIKATQAALSSFSRSPKLNEYFQDGTNLPGLKLMNEQQIATKINALSLDANIAPVKVGTGKADSAQVKKGAPTLTVDSAKQEVSIDLAHQVMLSVRQGNTSGWLEALKEQQHQLKLRADSLLPGNQVASAAQRVKRRAFNTAEKTQLNNDIDDAAQAITGIKEALASKGLDVKKILLMQRYQQTGGVGFAPEAANGFLSQQPVGTVQQVFAHLDALKFGAFGNQPSGGVENQDIFMKGAHVTVKSGGIPVTFGYGSVNDISSSKDNQFQGSVYNQFRNITYIGAELKRAGAGNLKVSVISSESRGLNNSSYAMPTLSSNNVALTLSKNLDLGKFGDFGFDVSKSSTVYSNKYQVGAEAILDQKGGLNYNLSNDLFQSLSFGVDHHMEYKDLDASDNVYFKYSGMGYQNPATNGFGGAKMKFGGNLRKSFYNNKLMMNVRTDITNMPISYTSNDRWKNYQVQLESRYQVNKKVNISIKYINNGTGKQVDGINSSVYSFQKIQFDGNASYKIGKYRTVSHFTIGDQSISNSFAPQTGSIINTPLNNLPVSSSPSSNFAAQNGANLLLVNYTQSTIIHQNVVTANIFVNRELSSYKLIGNMLNSDVSYQFILFGKLSMSSGITYLDNAGVARQAGVRESFSLMASKRFNIETFIDIRKNMIHPLYPDLYANYRAQLSVSYRISH
jgi:hypothetical protein